MNTKSSKWGPAIELQGSSSPRPTDIASAIAAELSAKLGGQITKNGSAWTDKPGYDPTQHIIATNIIPSKSIKNEADFEINDSPVRIHSDAK